MKEKETLMNLDTIRIEELVPIIKDYVEDVDYWTRSLKRDSRDAQVYVSKGTLTGSEDYEELWEIIDKIKDDRRFIKKTLNRMIGMIEFALKDYPRKNGEKIEK